MDRFKIIGSRIRGIRERYGETQEELAAHLGYSQATVAGYEAGRRRISIEDLERIADYYGVSVNYFLGREADSNYVQAELRRATRVLEEIQKRLQEVLPYSGEWIFLPLIGTVPTRYLEWQDEHEAEEFYPCSVEQLKKRDGAYALRVRGDSMIERRILDGDIIFVDSKRQAQPSDVVVARRDDEVVLRTYKQDAKGPHLQAGDQGYPILRLDDARILGVVVGLFREKP